MEKQNERRETPSEVIHGAATGRCVTVTYSFTEVQLQRDRERRHRRETDAAESVPRIVTYIYSPDGLVVRDDGRTN